MLHPCSGEASGLNHWHVIAFLKPFLWNHVTVALNLISSYQKRGGESLRKGEGKERATRISLGYS
jgi:hypothetical protein